VNDDHKRGHAKRVSDSEPNRSHGKLQHYSFEYARQFNQARKKLGL